LTSISENDLGLISNTAQVFAISPGCSMEPHRLLQLTRFLPRLRFTSGGFSMQNDPGLLEKKTPPCRVLRSFEPAEAGGSCHRDPPWPKPIALPC